MRKTRKRGVIAELIDKHIQDNFNIYLLMVLLFLIGIIIGVVVINNSSITQKQEIDAYIQNFINVIKNDYVIDKTNLLLETMKQNAVLGISMWFIGSTVIGIPIIFGIVSYRGFCLGYTIASVIGSIGTMNGIIFIVSSVLIQNILIIPAIMALAVSSFRCYKRMVKDRNRENIKIAIIKHTLFSIIIIVVLIIASITETFISADLVMKVVNLFVNS